MTREEAIKVLERYEPIEWGDDQDAFDMAIEALTHECDSCIYSVCNYNKVPWESNGELIDRQAAVEKILRNKDAKPLNESDYQDGIRAGLDIAYCEIRDLPSAEPVHGEWVEREDWNGDNYYDCSVCGESFVLIDGTPSMNLYHYCPNCGAKMGKEGNNE